MVLSLPRAFSIRYSPTNYIFLSCFNVAVHTQIHPHTLTPAHTHLRTQRQMSCINFLSRLLPLPLFWPKGRHGQATVALNVRALVIWNAAGRGPSCSHHFRFRCKLQLPVTSCHIKNNIFASTFWLVIYGPSMAINYLHFWLHFVRVQMIYTFVACFKVCH